MLRACDAAAITAHCAPTAGADRRRAELERVRAGTRDVVGLDRRLSGEAVVRVLLAHRCSSAASLRGARGAEPLRRGGNLMCMFFGLTIEKLLLIGLVAALLIGPERLPRYAESLAQLRPARAGVRHDRARRACSDEMGEDFDDVDWRTLDPRQYDPRRIIREALLDDAPVPDRARRAAPAAAVTSTSALTPPTPVAPAVHARDEPPPFDTEAT